LIPVCGGFLWLPAVIVGFGFNGCFAVFQSLLGASSRRRVPEERDDH
jgi:hypothetical protein